MYNFFVILFKLLKTDDCVLKMCYSIFVKRLISPAKNGLHLLRKKLFENSLKFIWYE